MLEKNRHVKLRDYDGGDLLEIVGQDFIGWQEDSLPKADVLIHLVGGYTGTCQYAYTIISLSAFGRSLKVQLRSQSLTNLENICYMIFSPHTDIYKTHIDGVCTNVFSHCPEKNNGIW